MSRQNYYAARRRRQRQLVDEELVVALVKRERAIQPRLGTRKLLFLLGAELRVAGVQLGRDRLFETLRRRGLLVARKPPGGVRTTNSRHSMPVFGNLIKDLKPRRANEVWVSDLTYIRTATGFVFAALITDLVTRKIVGAHVGNTLESIGCQRALEMALSQLPPGRYPIHHSDRGTQYCCHEYVDRLLGRGLKISMTEVNHCYENALAERVNGILKQEYELDQTFRNKAPARRAFLQAVEFYNQRRPHMSLDYRTPEQVHRELA